MRRDPGRRTVAMRDYDEKDLLRLTGETNKLEAIRQLIKRESSRQREAKKTQDCLGGSTGAGSEIEVPLKPDPLPQAQPDPSSSMVSRPEPLPQTAQTSQVSPVSISGSQAAQLSVMSFLPSNWREDFEERRLQLRGREVALEERKQDFREQALEKVLEFKRELLDFQKYRYRVIPLQNQGDDSGSGIVTYAKPEPRCFYCGDLGHFAYACPKSEVSKAKAEGRWR